jgi:drug/metabolite transporter (DMT)-like permease
MSAVMLAFLSAVSGGFANLFARRLVSVSQARNMLSVNFALMTGMLLPAAPWLFELRLDSKGFFLLMAAIGLDGLANYGYFRSFERVDAVTVSGLLAVSPLFALGISPLFFYQSESLGALQVLSVLLFTCGIWMIVGRFQHHSTELERVPIKEIFYPLGTAFLFTLSMFVIKDLFAGNYLNPYTYYLIRAFLISGVSWMITRPNLDWINGISLLLTAGRLIFVIGQWLFLLSALKVGHPAVVKAISDLSPMVVMMFSWSLLREKPSPMQVLGMVVILAGGSVLAL